MAKADYTVRWCKVTQEYVARTTSNPEVTGHSRDPSYALLALLTKVREVEGKALTAKKRPPASWASYKGRPAKGSLDAARNLSGGSEGVPPKEGRGNGAVKTRQSGRGSEKGTTGRCSDGG